MDTRELRYMLGWDQEDMAVAFSWSQSKVARFEADPSSVRLTDEDRVRLRRMRALADRKVSA
jgi:transcriptional regulator with XRE-family HTH domain